MEISICTFAFAGRARPMARGGSRARGHSQAQAQSVRRGSSRGGYGRRALSSLVSRAGVAVAHCALALARRAATIAMLDSSSANLVGVGEAASSRLGDSSLTGGSKNGSRSWMRKQSEHTVIRCCRGVFDSLQNVPEKSELQSHVFKLEKAVQQTYTSRVEGNARLFQTCAQVVSELESACAYPSPPRPHPSYPIFSRSSLPSFCLRG